MNSKTKPSLSPLQLYGDQSLVMSFIENDLRGQQFYYYYNIVAVFILWFTSIKIFSQNKEWLGIPGVSRLRFLSTQLFSTSFIDLINDTISQLAHQLETEKKKKT